MRLRQLITFMVIKAGVSRSSCHGSVVMNPTSIYEDVGSIPGLTQWVKDPTLLWLWCRLVATSPIQLLAWEPPYAVGEALTRQKKEKEKKEFSLGPPPWGGGGLCEGQRGHLCPPACPLKARGSAPPVRDFLCPSPISLLPRFSGLFCVPPSWQGQAFAGAV